MAAVQEVIHEIQIARQSRDDMEHGYSGQSMAAVTLNEHFASH